MSSENAYRPELGQMAFGNPWARYSLPDFVEALVWHVARESRRVYGNYTQRFDGWAKEADVPLHGQVIGGVWWFPYYWGDDESLKELPNFWFEDVEIRWYKNMGRNFSCTVNKTDAEWVAWFDRALKALRDVKRPDFLYHLGNPAPVKTEAEMLAIYAGKK